MLAARMHLHNQVAYRRLTGMHHKGKISAQNAGVAKW